MASKTFSAWRPSYDVETAPNPRANPVMLGGKIRAENGIAYAVEIIEWYYNSQDDFLFRTEVRPLKTSFSCRTTNKLSN